ncbi:hypothetical protein RCL1_001031 [Eukaryota sp. TZLM3-RCL]
MSVFTSLSELWSEKQLFSTLSDPHFCNDLLTVIGQALIPDYYLQFTSHDANSSKNTIIKSALRLISQPSSCTLPAQFNDNGSCWFDPSLVSSNSVLEAHLFTSKWLSSADSLQVLDVFLYEYVRTHSDKPHLLCITLSLLLGIYRLRARLPDSINVFKQNIKQLNSNPLVYKTFLQVLLRHVMLLNNTSPIFIDLQAQFFSLLTLYIGDHLINQVIQTYFGPSSIGLLVPCRYFKSSFECPVPVDEELRIALQNNNLLHLFPTKSTVNYDPKIFYFRDYMLFPILSNFAKCLRDLLSNNSNPNSLSLVLFALHSVYLFLRNLTGIGDYSTFYSLFLGHFSSNHLREYSQVFGPEAVFSFNDLCFLLSLGNISEEQLNQSNLHFILIDCVDYALPFLPPFHQRRLSLVLSELDWNTHFLFTFSHYSAWNLEPRIKHIRKKIGKLFDPTQIHPTERLLTGLMAQEFFPPELSPIKFLNFSDYVKRLIQLNRCTVASSLVDSFSQLLNNRCDDVAEEIGQIFGPMTSCLEILDKKFQISFNIPSSAIDFVSSNPFYALLIKFVPGSLKISHFRGGFISSINLIGQASSNISFTFNHGNRSSSSSTSDQYQVICQFSLDSSFGDVSEFPVWGKPTSVNQEFDCIFFPKSVFKSSFDVLKNLVKFSEIPLEKQQSSFWFSVFSGYVPVHSPLCRDLQLSCTISPSKLVSTFLESELYKFRDCEVRSRKQSNSTSVIITSNTNTVSMMTVSYKTDLTSFNPYQSQLNALISALTHSITCIVGPPGTGKTETCCSIIESTLLQLPRSDKILVLGHSNESVDQVIEKLSNSSLLPRNTVSPMFRIGLRSTSSVVQEFTVDGIIAKFKTFCFKIAKDMSRLNNDRAIKFQQSLLTSLTTDSWNQAVVELASLWSSYGLPIPSSFTGNFEKLPEELKLSHSLGLIIPFLAMNSRQQRNEVLSSAKLLAGTVNSVIGQISSLQDFNFDLVLIEEASTISEPELLPIFALKFTRLVLIGDDRQLRPFSPTPLLNRPGLIVPFFVRLRSMGITPIQLNVQGRALPELANLYRWRYNVLTDSLSSMSMPRFELIKNTVNWFNIDSKGGKDRETCSNEAKFICFTEEYCCYYSL